MSQPVSDEALHSTAQSDLAEVVDISELLRRFRRGFGQILGLALVGMVIAACGFIITTRWLDVSTGTRISLAFEGLERGEYPDRSKFQSEDLRAPDLVLEALRRRNLETSEAVQTRIRAALNVEGIIPGDVTKQRDRMRTNGQTPPIYIPDEYLYSLLLPRNFPLSYAERERLLIEIVNVFREKFLRTYGTLPSSIGNAFTSLEGADYYEYELILKQDIQNTIDFLTLQLEKDRTFRSATTNLSFSDLLKQTQIFSQVRLFESLGQIYASGLSRDRRTAMVKVDYSLRTVEDRLDEAVQQENVIKELLKQAQDRGQNYVLGLKSQGSEQKQNTPIVDQGLIDSLLTNDAYNYLIREALKAGRRVKELEAEHAQLTDRRRLMESFMEQDPTKQAADITRVQKSLADLRSAYNKLMDDIRRTREDYTRQKFANVVRLSAGTWTENIYKNLAICLFIGGFLGILLGIGLSFLEVYIRGVK